MSLRRESSSKKGCRTAIFTVAVVIASYEAWNCAPSYTLRKKEATFVRKNTAEFFFIRWDDFCYMKTCFGFIATQERHVVAMIVSITYVFQQTEYQLMYLIRCSQSVMSSRSYQLIPIQLMLYRKPMKSSQAMAICVYRRVSHQFISK